MHDGARHAEGLDTTIRLLDQRGNIVATATTPVENINI